MVSRNLAVACILTLTLSTGLTTTGCSSPQGGATSSGAPSTPSPIAAQSAPAGPLTPLPAGVPSGGAFTPAPAQVGIDLSKLKQVNGKVKNVSVSAKTIEVEHDAVESLKLQKGSTVFHTDLPVLRTFRAGDEIIVNIDDSKGENVIVALLNPKAAPSGFSDQGRGGQIQGQQGIPPQGQGGQAQGAPIQGPGGQPQGPSGAPIQGPSGQPQGPQGAPSSAPR